MPGWGSEGWGSFPWGETPASTARRGVLTRALLFVPDLGDDGTRAGILPGADLVLPDEGELFPPGWHPYDPNDPVCKTHDADVHAWW